MSVLQAPGRYLRSVPPAIRLLSVGVFLNQLGAYVAVFLALILAVRGFDARHIALALVLVSVFGILGSSAGGVLASRIGTRRTIVATMAGSAFFTVFLALNGSYLNTVVCACFIAFFNRGCQPASIATVGELATADQRVPMFGFYQLALNLGAAAGPLIAGFLLTRSLVALLLIDAATSLGFAVAALRLPRQKAAGAEPARGETGGEDTDGQRRGPRGSWWARRTVLADRRFLVLCVGFALVAGCYGQQAGAFPLELRAHHYSLELLGGMFTANAIAVILFQVPVAIAVRRLQARIPLAAAAALMGGGYAIFLLGMSVPTIIASVCLWTGGELLMAPTAPAVAMNMSSAGAHGRYQGALLVARTTGQTLGPTAGVFASSFSPALPWWGCGLAGLAAISIFVPLLGNVPLTPGTARG
ncbi:MAG TPA: MFS transporter [Streptosporangiaceae bacterium]|nr:MFS transporter [Streptosporangiaceae bacterium]